MDMIYEMDLGDFDALKWVEEMLEKAEAELCVAEAK